MALEYKHKVAIGAVLVILAIAVWAKMYRNGYPKSGFCGKTWDPASTAEAQALSAMGVYA